MGEGISCRCKKCGYTFSANLGVGFMFPKVYSETVFEMKKGTFGEIGKQFFEEYPHGAISCDGTIMSPKPITMPIDVVELLGEHMCELDREVVCVINLRSDGTPVNCNFVSMGAVDECVAHPREILKSCILSNAASMIMLHNHPSGKLNPSKWDTMITDRMLKVGELIGIPLRDHIIVGGDNHSYFSFREKGLNSMRRYLSVLEGLR